MGRIKILALFGKSGAGKDAIQNWVTSDFFNTKKIISCTTRPKRDYEIEDVDYHFIDEETFARKVLDNTIVEATSFNNWFYGTPIEELDDYKINVGVFNLTGVECLLDNEDLNVLPVYIQAPDKIRLMRDLNREQYPDCQEICRRFLADEKDFRFVDFDYEIYCNNDNDNNFIDFVRIPAIKEFLA